MLPSKIPVKQNSNLRQYACTCNRKKTMVCTMPKALNIRDIQYKQKL